VNATNDFYSGILVTDDGSSFFDVAGEWQPSFVVKARFAYFPSAPFPGAEAFLASEQLPPSEAFPASGLFTALADSPDCLFRLFGRDFTSPSLVNGQ
jgi:hypothetical protein